MCLTVIPKVEPRLQDSSLSKYLFKMYKSNEIKMKTQAGMKPGANGTSQHYKEPG